MKRTKVKPSSTNTDTLGENLPQSLKISPKTPELFQEFTNAAAEDGRK